jgi:uncharacterized membrane protein SirB2
VAEDETDNTGRAIERVTIAEAAALLGCHPNTVRSRVKTGMYRAEKFHTENGPTWMIERDSLTTNAPTTARQQGVSGVPAAQQEAIQELARAIVKEARVSQDPEWQAQLESNKLAMEAAKTQLLVGSGLLVGMGAVVGILPDASRASPLLYSAFAFVVLSVYTGIVWMREIAAAMGRSERHPLHTEGIPNMGGVSSLLFVVGVGVFALYVVWSSPGDEPDSWLGSWILSPDTPSEQSRWLVAFLVLIVLLVFGANFLRRWRKRRRSRESESPPSNSA